MGILIRLKCRCIFFYLLCKYVLGLGGNIEVCVWVRERGCYVGRGLGRFREIWEKGWWDVVCDRGRVGELVFM